VKVKEDQDLKTHHKIKPKTPKVPRKMNRIILITNPAEIMGLKKRLMIKSHNTKLNEGKESQRSLMKNLRPPLVKMRRQITKIHKLASKIQPNQTRTLRTSKKKVKRRIKIIKRNSLRTKMDLQKPKGWNMFGGQNNNNEIFVLL
jgi:hypothetical protein